MKISLKLAIAVNVLLVGVLLYSVAFSGSSKNVGAGLAPRMTRMNRLTAARAFLNNPEMVPDMGKRKLMNNLVLAAVAPVVASTAGPYLYYFYPPQTGGGGGAIAALDALGTPVTTSSWFEKHKANSRDLVQGLKGDPTYLIVNEENTLNSYGLNAVCTHLGCVVPWNAGENKFKCPCHGSQYAPDGHVIRGPAPRPLALAHVSDESGKILLGSWTETDFRTGEKPWWS
mmetsp:Transcript_22149/g.54199  ORF Transcript_22149/g.54199 Transcript_22149/m.54199 type:complete len:229 (-) Transcript_22149:417-1103(-)